MTNTEVDTDGMLIQAIPFNRINAGILEYLPNIGFIPINYRTDSAAVKGTNPTGHGSTRPGQQQTSGHRALKAR